MNLTYITPNRKMAEQQIKALLPRFSSAYSLGPRHMILSEYKLDLRDYYEQHKMDLREIVLANGLMLDSVTACFEKNVGTEITIKFRIEEAE